MQDVIIEEAGGRGQGGRRYGISLYNLLSFSWTLKLS